MNTKTGIILITCIALLTGAIGFYAGYNWNDPKPNNIATLELSPDFKTQFINLNKRFDQLPIDTAQHLVKPITVNYYLPSKVPSISVNCRADSLLQIIDSLHHVIITIDQKYLKLFPNNPKLIAGYFSRDTLKVSLLNIDGQITSYLYGTDYNLYSYQFLNGDFRANSNPKVAHEPMSSINSYNNSFYVSLGYTSINSSILTSLDYQILFKRMKFDASMNISVYPKNDAFVMGKVGYRINKQ